MRLGIFCKTFPRPMLEAALDAIVGHGLECVQFNMACAGLPPMPEHIEPAFAASIRRSFADRGLTMAAISGTFNMIHPDPRIRAVGLERLEVMASACEGLGTNVITLCTGTRDPEDIWRRHPENDTPSAWRDLVGSVGEAIRLTEPSGVVLAVEPEVANVVDSAAKARRLLDEIGSPRLKVVIDAANLFPTGGLSRMHAILDDAFALLGKDIVLAHAKDLAHDGEAGHEAAGTGLLDYDHYLQGLMSCGFDGPLILHGLAEGQVAGCVHFLRGKLDKLAARAAG